VRVEFTTITARVGPYALHRPPLFIIYAFLKDLSSFMEHNEIKTVCYICGIVMKPGPDKPVSHGFCKSCFLIEIEKLNKIKKQK